MENQETKPANTTNLFSRFKFNRPAIKYGVIIFAVLVLSGIAWYWYAASHRVYSDKAEIYAPLIILSPNQPNTLRQIMVKNGEAVTANQAVAQLDGGELIRAKTDGLVVNTNNEVGKLFSPGTPVVTMINPDDLRLIVHVAENKGLKSVHVGQNVKFTVDAYGSKKFTGRVEEISQTSDESSVVFSISDKRDEKYYSIKVKYGEYPQLLNGMPAKAWNYN